MSGWWSGRWRQLRLWQEHHVTQSHLWVHLSTRYQGQTKATPSGKLVSTKVTGLRMHGGAFKMCSQAFISNVTENCFWNSHWGIHILFWQPELPVMTPQHHRSSFHASWFPDYDCFQTVREMCVYSENIICFGSLLLGSNSMDLRSVIHISQL